MKILLAMPSSPGAFLQFKLSIVCRISSVVKSLSSFVSIGFSINVLIRLCCSVFSSSLSMGMRCSSVHCIVSLRSSVCYPLVFRKVDIICLLFNFPTANLCIVFHALVDDVFLQYFFHDCILGFFNFS